LKNSSENTKGKSDRNRRHKLKKEVDGYSMGGNEGEEFLD
jgi:hypothetical protein